MAGTSIEVALVDLTTHYYPLDEQIELARRLAEADIRIWLTDQTMSWWPDGIYEGEPIAREWPKHSFWDRYVQTGVVAHEVPDSRWAIAVDAVRRSPDVMAQSMMTLHEWTGGRVMFAIAAGEIKQLTPFGYEEEKPFTRVEETFRLLHELWTRDEPITFDGETIRYRNAYMGNRSSDGTLPPLTTIGLSPRLRKVAARYGRYVPVGGSADSIREQIEEFRAEAAAFGRDPDELKFWSEPGWGMPDRPEICLWEFTAETAEDEDVIRRSLMTKWSATGGWFPMPNSPFPPDYHYARDMVPTEWDAARVHRYLDQVPEGEFPIVFLTEDDLVARIIACADAGIDLLRFSDRSAEIHPPMRWRSTELYVRAAKRAQELLAAR